jgi:hypothetical protein|tara:strand:- start:7024 stop:7689 length:666 start_codon:yes stop_codon:yes gene_type:complete
MTSDKILNFIFNLKKLKTPSSIEVLDPYINKETIEIVNNFYKKFYSDNKKRIICFGINPGRFGGGITGIPFTDPFYLEKNCNIISSFRKKKEISSSFIYEMIDSYGGVKKFYKKFFISSICPYGFVEDGKNFNYYDNKVLLKNWKKSIIKWIEIQLNNFGDSDQCIIIGKGKNQNFFELINKEYKFFDKIITLPHPRWIMQYKLKEKEKHINNYITTLKNI